MLKYYPEPVLLIPSKDVQNFDFIPGILDEMIGICKETRALGIAAPQIGHSLNILLLKSKNTLHEIINPVIISEEGEQFETEGCLSFPGVFIKTKRPYQVHFHYKSRTNEYKEAVVFGMEAVCLKHEMDHLLGRTLLDNVNRAERKRIIKELKNG